MLNILFRERKIYISTWWS